MATNSHPGSNPTRVADPYPSDQFDHVVSAVHELEHPTKIGPYFIQQLIGEGGMGTVYRAEQREPIQRTVAVKVIKLGMDTRQVIARFESERQALALMNHPNVARVLDAGSTESGRPYFVMEYVQGEPITSFADRHKLTMPQRLELFVQACDAVQHAHQKAIIHRDLKPSNILVGFQDGNAVVKVIDFGVAKAVSQRLTERTFFTENGQLVGTPEYMAPEQAESNALDVDTRSDVYSLGVVLYELLSGSLPFDPESLRSAGFGEIQRIIREVDPPNPSTRVSSMGEQLSHVAECRRVEPKKLGTLVRGELDWIVMKAMEKDRARRYDSPSALASDVQRYLSDEPVAASPPSGAYRARKFIRRHRWGLAMTGALALAVLAGLGGTTFGLLRARQQRDQAIAAQQAEAEAREYETQTDRFLIDMFKSIKPEEARGKDVLVKDLLDKAAERVETTPPKHKIVQAYLRTIFGDAYLSLGLLEQARMHLQKSLELDSPTDKVSRHRVAGTLNSLGLTYKAMGQISQAHQTLQQALDMQRGSVGPDDPDAIATQANLAAVLIEEQKLDAADAMLADALDRIKRVPAVDPFLRASVVNDLALLRQHQGKLADAEKILRDALADWKRDQGEDHPGSIAMMSNLANLLREEGKAAESVDLLARALEMSRKVNGPDHPDTLVAENNLALAYQGLGRLEDSQKTYLDTIERLRRIRGDDDPGMLLARSNYGLLLQAMNKLDDAEATFRDVLERMKRVVGENDINTLTAQSNLAWLLAFRGDLAGGEAMYRDVVARCRDALGADHPVTLLFSTRLGFILAQDQKWAEAETLMSEAYAKAKAQGITAMNPMFMEAYGDCLAHLDRPAEAVPIFQQADALARDMPRQDPTMLRRIAGKMAAAYDKLGQPDQAQIWRQKASSQPAMTQPQG